MSGNSAVIERTTIDVGGMAVEVVRKGIKHLHLSVHPPDGRVSVSAPMFVGDDAIRLAVSTRLGWIRRQQTKFAAQERQSEREMVNGESHYYLGQRYRLEVEEVDAPPRVILHGGQKMVLQVRPGADAVMRRAVLEAWYRAEMKALIPALVAKWEPIMGVKVTDWRIKRMKTRWGTCNIKAGRIWLNLELVKKTPQCIEYVLVHEMVHLLERHHNARFKELMGRFLPQWQMIRAELNAMPLVHEEWKY